MIIQVLTHYHLRTCSTLFIHFLNLIIGKCSICITESRIHNTITCTIPHISMIIISLSAISVTTPNRHI